MGKWKLDILLYTSPLIPKTAFRADINTAHYYLSKEYDFNGLTRGN